ncbi:UNVERIFIED_CONTAM: undecaprenyl-diphosphatase [Williamsia faeni]
MLIQSPVSSEAELLQSSDQATSFGPDQYVLDWMVDHRTDTWTTVMKAITTLGNTTTLFVVATVVTVAFAIGRKWRLALFVGLGSAAGSLLMVFLKELFGRERPPMPERMIDLSSHSFPSGHAMCSTIVYGLVAVALYQASSWVRSHVWVLLFAPLLALSIGISRVYLGAHWMTDVVAGWILGALFVAGATWMTFRPDPAEPPDSLAAQQASADTPQNTRTDPPQDPPDKS